MTIDIPVILFKLLHRHERVGVPGLGDFRTTPRSAVIDHVQGVIHPPFKVLSFEESPNTSGDALIQSIRQTYNIDTNTAQQAINYYVAQIQEALSRKEFVAIPSVGRICRNHENKIQFFTDNNNFSTAVYGLPAVQYYPILRNSETPLHISPSPTPVPTAIADIEKPLSTAPSLESAANVMGGASIDAQLPNVPPSTFSNTKMNLLSGIEWRKILPITAAIIGFFSVAMFISRTVAANKATGTAKADIELQSFPIATEQINTPSSANTPKTNNDGIDSLANIYSTPKSGDDFKAYPSEKSQIGDAFSTNNKATSKPTTTNNDDLIFDAGGNGFDTTPKGKKKNVHAVSVNTVKKAKGKGRGKGIMVIGSFKEGDNVQKLINKIKEVGFEPYKEYKNNMVRIGVKMPAYSSELEKTSIIQEIRAFFGANAWLMI